jgi:hypothetical protein
MIEGLLVLVDSYSFVSIFTSSSVSKSRVLNSSTLNNLDEMKIQFL